MANRTHVVDSGGTSRLVKRWGIVDSGGTTRMAKRVFVVDSGGVSRLIFNSALLSTTGTAGQSGNTFGYAPLLSIGSIGDGVIPGVGSIVALGRAGDTDENFLQVSAPSDPGKGSIESVAVTVPVGPLAGTVTLNSSDATYTYSGGVASWTWDAATYGRWGFGPSYPYGLEVMG